MVEAAARLVRVPVASQISRTVAGETTGGCAQTVHSFGAGIYRKFCSVDSRGRKPFTGMEPPLPDGRGEREVTGSLLREETGGYVSARRFRTALLMAQHSEHVIKIVAHHLRRVVRDDLRCA